MQESLPDAGFRSLLRMLLTEEDLSRIAPCRTGPGRKEMWNAMLIQADCIPHHADVRFDTYRLHGMVIR